jgi:hypothetical protein
MLPNHVQPWWPSNLLGGPLVDDQGREVDEKMPWALSDAASGISRNGELEPLRILVLLEHI